MAGKHAVVVIGVVGRFELLGGQLRRAPAGPISTLAHERCQLVVAERWLFELFASLVVGPKRLLVRAGGRATIAGQGLAVRFWGSSDREPDPNSGFDVALPN